MDRYEARLRGRILTAEPACSVDIYHFIRELGYTGSERTVRNYVNPIKRHHETQGHYETGHYTVNIPKGDFHHATDQTD